MDSPSYEKNLITEINVTPITDIFMVLLIVFMITATGFIVEGKVINLPKSSESQSITAGVTVTITKSLNILVGNKKMTIPEFKDFLVKKLPEISDGNITLEADEDVPVKMIISVMDLAEEIGIKRINISTRKK